MYPVSVLPRYFISSELMLVISCCLFIPSPGYSENMSLQSLSLRGRFSSNDLLGATATESFKAYDFSANFDLPWNNCTNSGLCMGAHLFAVAGIMEGAGENALVASLTPALALGREDGRFIFDAGAGGAFLSRHRFGTQDFGGHFQFSLTVGIGVTLHEKLGVGYRYQHYSDAGIYGPGNVGVDMHMIELIYEL